MFGLTTIKWNYILWDKLCNCVPIRQVLNKGKVVFFLVSTYTDIACNRIIKAVITTSYHKQYIPFLKKGNDMSINFFNNLNFTLLCCSRLCNNVINFYCIVLFNWYLLYLNHLSNGTQTCLDKWMSIIK